MVARPYLTSPFAAWEFLPFFPLRFPIFISSCGFGGMLSIRRAICNVVSSRFGLGALAMARSVVIGPSLPTELYQPIGHLVFVWARMEEEIDNLLDDLFRCPVVGGLPPIPASFARRADWMEKAAALCFAGCPTLAEKLIAIAKRAFALGQDRNLIVHGRLWFGKPMLAFNRKREIELTVESVARLIHEIASLAQRMAQINRSPALPRLRPDHDVLTPHERAVLRTLDRSRPIPDAGCPGLPIPPSILRQRRASPA